MVYTKRAAAIIPGLEVDDVAKFSDSIRLWLRRAAVDPPHRVAARFLETVHRTGMVRGMIEGRLLAAARVMLEQGLSAGTVHRLYGALEPRRLAVVDDHRSVTYQRADTEIDELAVALRHRFGIREGVPVAMMMENRVEYVLAWFATFRLGAPSVHVSYRATAEELDYQLDHSGARVVLCSEKTRDVVRRVQRERSDWRLVAVDIDAREHDEGMFAYEELLRAAERIQRSRSAGELRARSPEEANNVVYTSGTTGRPKGTVRNLARLGIHDLFRIVERLPVRTNDRHLVVTPIYHSGGQVFTLLNASLGATIYLRPGFEPEDTLRSLSEFGIHSLFLVPTMIRQLLSLPEEAHEAYRTPDFRALVSGAAPFPEALRRRAIRRFGARAVHDFYGATELGWVTLINGREMLHKPGSVGKPIAGQEVRIADGETVCDPGEVGTIYVRSEHTMEGYLHDERANEDFRQGEWVTVEDLGYVDDDGYLFLAGRSRDMVISGGVNIYPVEIEDVLVDHEGVDDAGVIGVDDPEWGEKVVAYVVPSSEPPEVEALESWVRRHLAGYKVPKDWVYTEALPRNATGKIEKTKLESRYSAERRELEDE